MAICEITLEGTYQQTATGDLANVQVVIHFTSFNANRSVTHPVFVGPFYL